MKRSELLRRLLVAVAKDHNRIRELEDMVDQLMRLLQKHKENDHKH